MARRPIPRVIKYTSDRSFSPQQPVQIPHTLPFVPPAIDQLPASHSPRFHTNGNPGPLPPNFPSTNHFPQHVIDFAANHPSNLKAIMLSMGIGGSSTPISGVRAQRDFI